MFSDNLLNSLTVTSKNDNHVELYYLPNTGVRHKRTKRILMVMEKNPIPADVVGVSRRSRKEALKAANIIRF